VSDLFSLSWLRGYIARNQYHFNKGLGSLTPGGYDASLLQPSEPTFDSNMNSNFDLSVPVKSVSMSLADGTRNLTSLISRDLQSESL
jgi:hypothetical protein